MDVGTNDLISRNLNRKNLPEKISDAEIHVRLNPDPVPCRTRGGDILRAQDRLQRPTGPLTAPRGVWPIQHGRAENAPNGPRAARRRERP